MKIDSNLERLIIDYPWTTSKVRVKGKYVYTYEFALLFIEKETVSKVAKKFSCSTVTITNCIKKSLPEIYNPNGGQIYARILNLVGHRKCYKCNEVKSAENMCSRNNSTDYLCKVCSHEYSTSKLGRLYKSANENTRRAALLSRTPRWANLEDIKLFYLSRPEGFHVDHIIPLQGTRVSGLHVLENLQYLPSSENISKSNKYEVT